MLGSPMGARRVMVMAVPGAKPRPDRVGGVVGDGDDGGAVAGFKVGEQAGRVRHSSSFQGGAVVPSEERGITLTNSHRNSVAYPHKSATIGGLFILSQTRVAVILSPRLHCSPRVRREDVAGHCHVLGSGVGNVTSIALTVGEGAR